MGMHSDFVNGLSKFAGARKQSCYMEVSWPPGIEV